MDLSPEQQKQLFKHLRAADGYLDLGMAIEAWDELESIEAEHRSFGEVLKIRLKVCRALEKWEIMSEIAQFLAKNEPDESNHLLNLAFAKRRLDGVESAEEIPAKAEVKFPEDALIKYNLGCYRAVAGRIADARLALAEAFQKDPELRITALEDPDLVGIW